MTPGFLEQLDGWLKSGWRTLAPALRESVGAAIVPFAGADGGYRGRHGPSDRYYTDFAVRLLDLADAPPEEFERVAGYLNECPSGTDLVHLFCQLNATRLLRGRGVEVPAPADAGPVLAAQRTVQGAFAYPGRTEPSAYLTFLAALVYELTGTPFPEPGKALAALRQLRKDDGGFSDEPGRAPAQASTTAAAMAAFGLLGALDVKDAAHAGLFLAGLQTPDGGIRAHREAPEADLLSTFTVLTCLAGMRALDLVRLAPIGRFILALRTTEGGFRGSASDPEYDVEYTYYGVGSLCLLQAHLTGEQ